MDFLQILKDVVTSDVQKRILKKREVKFVNL